MEKIGYTIKCNCHNYVTLEHEGKFIFCFDNDFYPAEEIIFKIEKKNKFEFS